MAVLSESDRKALENNPNVLKVTESNVTYTPQFKIRALKELAQGMSPRKIFENAGINISIFGEDYVKGCLRRWKQVADQSGESSLKSERRGLKATGRPKGQRFKSVEEEIAYLRAENDFLKKLRALEAKPEKKKSSR